MVHELAHEASPKMDQLHNKYHMGNKKLIQSFIIITHLRLAQQLDVNGDRKIRDAQGKQCLL